MNILEQLIEFCQFIIKVVFTIWKWLICIALIFNASIKAHQLGDQMMFWLPAILFPTITLMGTIFIWSVYPKKQKGGDK